MLENHLIVSGYGTSFLIWYWSIIHDPIFFQFLRKSSAFYLILNCVLQLGLLIELVSTVFNIIKAAFVQTNETLRCFSMLCIDSDIFHCKTWWELAWISTVACREAISNRKVALAYHHCWTFRMQSSWPICGTRW